MLFFGPAIVIDDNIAEGNVDQINDLILEIENRSIPCVKLLTLPDADEVVEHLDGVSFLILDWELRPKELEDTSGIQMPDSWTAQNVEFLKSIMAKVFLPIFIFTASDIDNIKQKLQSEGLYDPAGNNRIFVENKNSLVGGHLFARIEEWTAETSSVYVLKEWEREYKKAKNGLFIDFYGLSHAWPKVLWKTYKADGNGNMGLGDMITRNLYTRMSPFQFDEATINRSPGPEPVMEQLRNVLEGERFIPKARLSADDKAPGDLFYTPNGTTYLLNIRAACDVVRESNPDLYLLKGKVLDVTTDSGLFLKGEFRERHTNAIIACVDNGKVIEFDFRKFELKKWDAIKAGRIGRLLPPHITRIQQKYALFQQREGVSPIPREAFYTDAPAMTGPDLSTTSIATAAPEITGESFFKEAIRKWSEIRFFLLDLIKKQ